MFILAERNDAIGTLIFNQPTKRNPLSAALVEELITALDSFQKEGIRVVVLRAARDARVWSSGHDITELPQGQDPLPYSDSFEQALRAIKTFPTPIIAMVHGSVWGVATDLVLSCDIAIGDETSSFAVTPANIGLAYNTSGLLRFMRRLPLNRVKEMFFIAEPVTAAEAVEWGILNHLVEADRLEDYTYDLARRIATKAPLVLRVVKEQLRILTDASPITSDVFERIEALRESVYQSADYLEGIRAFQQKRPPSFSGN
jgi:methylmalonyl-CoA decarboxylase